MVLALGAHAARPARGHGQNIEERLRVQPGATCLNADRLAGEIEQWLDGMPVARDLEIFVEGDAAQPRNVRVNILRAGQVVARRDFEPGPASCEHLHSAVALALAMSLKALLREGEAGEAITRAPQPEPEPPEQPRWSIAGAGLVSYRMLPELAPGVALGMRYGAINHFALRLTVLGTAAFGVPLERAPGSFDSTWLAARADACGKSALVGALHGMACLGFMGGLLHVSGSDVANAESSAVPLAALSGAGELELRLSASWAIALELSASLLLHGADVGVADASGERAVWRSLSRLGFALGLGPAYYFY